MKAKMLRQILGLVLILAFVEAQERNGNWSIEPRDEALERNGDWSIQPRDEPLERNGNWSIQPRASGTFACSRRPRVVTLSPGDVATFSSPRYPSSYPNRHSCGWKFRTSSSTARITVTCSSFTLQPAHRGRCRDYLAFGRRKYCGSTGPTSVTATTRYVRLWFRSDRRINNRGFTCTASVAGTVVTVPPVVTNAPSGRCVCGKANRGTRIVGGQTTEVNEYPWQVALVSRGGTSVYCGGSLISDRWVLTAAHCTQSGVSQVLLGNHLQSQTDSAERRINVKRVVDHPSYNSRNLDNDFSLLELSTKLNLDSVDPEIRPVCLPSASNPSQYENVLSVISGWGTTSEGGFQPNALKDTTVKTMSNSQCNQNYGGAILNSMICAASPGRDSCQGDSGGPLVRNVGGYFNLIGVVSWGSGCANPQFPGVYSRVTNAINWITTTSRSGKTCASP